MADQDSVRPILDHIVVLVSYQTLQELPKRLEQSLTVIDGGAHADGRTVNKLIIFPDGVYIELIAFQENLDPQRRKQHRWGQLDEGVIIDWAHTLPQESDFAEVQRRVEETGAGVTYQDPVAGGRIRPDGVELKWAVASAQDASGKPLWPGTAPFWCLDRTARRLRVPYQGEGTSDAPSYTKHPSGALGVSQVLVSVPKQDVPVISKVYDGIHGPASASETSSDTKSWSFIVHSGSTQGKHQISLAASQSQQQRITLALLGTKDSPRSIDVLPGLTLTFDS